MKPRYGELISVIIPTYNRRELLANAIDSILDQSYDNLEIVIVDDASTDGTLDMLEKKYGDIDNMICIINDSNQGPAAARNTGVLHCHGNIIAFHDSDDLWMKQKLEKQMHLLAEASDDTAMIYCSMLKKQGSNSITVPDPSISLEEKSGKRFLHSLLIRPFVGAPTMLMKKEVFLRLGGFDISLNCLEDYEFSLRIVSKYNTLIVDEPLYIQRLWENGSVNANNRNFVQAMAIIMHKYFDIYKNENLLEEKMEYDLAVSIGRDSATEYLKQLATLGKTEYIEFVKTKLGILRST